VLFANIGDKTSRFDAGERDGAFDSSSRGTVS